MWGVLTHLLLSHVNAFLHVFKLLVVSFAIYLADARGVSFCFCSLLASWRECCSVFPVERASTVSWRTGTASRGSSHFSLFLADSTQLDGFSCLLFHLPLGNLPLIVYMSTLLRLSKERQRKKSSVGPSATLKDSGKQRRRGAGEQSCPSEHLKLLSGLSSAAPAHIQTVPVPKACRGLRERYKHTSCVLLNTPSCRRASSGSLKDKIYLPSMRLSLYTKAFLHFWAWIIMGQTFSEFNSPFPELLFRKQRLRQGLALVARYLCQTKSMRWVPNCGSTEYSSLQSP